MDLKIPYMGRWIDSKLTRIHPNQSANAFRRPCRARLVLVVNQPVSLGSPLVSDWCITRGGTQEIQPKSQNFRRLRRRFWVHFRLSTHIAGFPPPLLCTNLEQGGGETQRYGLMALPFAIATALLPLFVTFASIQLNGS